MNNKLHTRKDFRELCLKRDNHKCVMCNETNNLAVHHIMERRLFDDGGYYLDNGSTLCEYHHIEAEKTTLDCDTIREACNIDNIILPEHLYSDQEYDKWGNPIINNNVRLKGELFNDESVQKILEAGKVLDLFSVYIKYPRTYFVPWGDKSTKDDKKLKNDDHFKNKKVVVTVKMDGENTSIYPDYVHARSINSGSHPTRNKIKELSANIGYQLSKDERICGENLFAKHSILYDNLPSYFMMFSHWEGSTCLSWDETCFNAEVLELDMVPVIYTGLYDKDKIIDLYEKNFKGTGCEGYVIRIYDEFEYGQFRKSVMKYVEPEFKQKVNSSHGHWISKKIEPNGLRK